MRRIVVVLLCAFSISACTADHRVRSVDDLQRTPIHQFNERELDAYLSWLHSANKTLTERVTLLARQSIGQPYKLGLLGEFPCELYDPDPLYCLSASDCVTFVEQTYAMALAHDWPTFFQALQKIRYRDGVVGIRTRNHFTEADWNVNNAWLFEDITAILGGVQTTPMTLHIDRQTFFAKFGVQFDEPVQLFEDRFLPRESVESASRQFHDGDVIEFVRGGDAPYVGHLGLIVHDTTGNVNLIHSTKPAVMEISLRTYIEKHANVRGVKVLRTIRS